MGDEYVSPAQIVADYKHAIYLAVYERVARSREGLLGAIVNLEVVLLGLTFDALIENGDWSPLGATEVPEGVPLPAYREAVGFPPKTFVVDHSGRRRRLATHEEELLLPTRKMVAPIRIERALRALYGFGEWSPKYDSLLPSKILTSAETFP
ncbi:hypothetical protein [Pseudonocardia oroxyli]|uniref:hypothetical protein n=1 Tax=Pseudonocardia oroxyli TaxID=366584 RepID=UPI00115FE727|nr:hypothetical protein [Pseudonocardia oroxyli]